MNDLEQFKTRWHRWLGQKCRKDHSYWTTLLDSHWMSWAGGILARNGKYSTVSSVITHMKREHVKAIFKEAIELANINDLLRLDNLYCQKVVKDLV